MSLIWQGKRVLVTGSAGVIGTSLVRKLSSQGATILSIDLSPFKTSYEQKLKHIQTNLANHIPKEVSAFDPEVVFHLAAAFERTVETLGYWITSFENNVLLSHLLLRELEQCPSLRTFVFASSYLVYDPRLYRGNQGVYYLRESDAIAPRNLVGLAKYFTERELEFIQKTVGKYRTISARIYRVYGRGSRDVISRFIRSSLRGKPIEVWGRKNRFDYIFADDVAEGLMRLAESEAIDGIVNLGSGVPHSIDDVINILRSKLDNVLVQDCQCDYALEASCADMSLFYKITGWLPGTSLKDGISEIIAYEQRRMADEI